MTKLTPFDKRAARVRYQLKKNNKRKLPRLTVFRSNSNIHVQIIDDSKGMTLAAASTVSKDYKGPKNSSVESATLVGKLIAEKAKSMNISEVVFDKGAYLYHGKIKAVADAARENGLIF